MPPILARKRLHSTSPVPESPPKRARTTRKPSAPARTGKVSVFQTLDAPPKTKRTLLQTKALLEEEEEEEDGDGESSEPESTEDEFEDVPLNGATKDKGKPKARPDEDSDESEDGDWEDALGTHHHTKPDHGPAPVITGDIALTLSAAPKTVFETKPDGKKGPSKVQRQIRTVTHCMHVQFLMFHNLIRNAWIQDKEVQKTLVQAMSPGCWRELEKYWNDAGIRDGSSRVVVQKPPSPKKKEPKASKGKWKESGKAGVKVYESPQKRIDVRNKAKGKGEKPSERDKKTRDWGAAAEPLEPNSPNLSAGDPLIRLLKYLSAYWKSKFQITAPSLRKRGYLSPSVLEAEIKAWKDDPNHPDTFGERVEDIAAFRECAKKCQGSRDIGEQLFTALIRGLGIEARMVVSLQPVGFGWSQNEEGKPKNLKKLNNSKSADNQNTEKETPTSSKAKKPATAKKTDGSVDVSMDGSSDLSSVISISSDSEDNRPPKRSPRARNYGEELPYPTYWTEAISHLAHTPISVSPLPRTIIASAASPDKLVDFYARGAAVDKAKQILAYLIAFSSDGSAKDVTTRYLPKHQWPGRTKGFRMPVEKVPIHNKHGKVKRWEEWDWCKSLMRPYTRAHDKRQPWDEVEDECDLVPAQAERKKGMDEEGGKETLQGYKNSTEYVLERHLRREEALRRGAKIVRFFITGKGDNEKSEPVYRRKDVVLCKTQESWHKEGREVLEGQQPLKLVPMRAVTVTRKREIEERERIEGGKVKQGLYSKEQTDWIIPDPIVDGKIPRNAFGNIDVYVPTMVPKGAVHVPLKGTARICRKLNIDYAEACTGFEFGKQRAVPVITGVVVAAEHEDMLIDAWEAEEVEKQRKEREKREKFLLGLWRRFASGLRIVDRMREEYGEDMELPVKEEVLPSKDEEEKPKTGQSQWEVFEAQTDFEGGFVREDVELSGGGGFVPDKAHQTAGRDLDMAGSFLPASQEEDVELTIDHGEKKDVRAPVVETAYRTPISLTQALQRPPSEPSENPDANEATSIDQDTEDEGKRNDEDEEYEHSKLESDHRKSTTATSGGRGRGRPRGRGTKAPARLTRKPNSTGDELSNGALSDAPSNPQSPPPSRRSAPRRKAARKSDAHVRSHFFAEASEDETDLTDMTDRTSPKKKSTRGRGTGRGRGRGRGKAGKAK